MGKFVYRKRGEHAILRQKGGMVDQHIHNLAQQVHSRAVQKVGVDTGNLRASITLSSITSTGGMPAYRVGSDNKIARLHHDGSRPHLIEAKKGSVLRFGKYGTIVYRKKVFHPGTSPNRYLTDPLRAVI